MGKKGQIGSLFWPPRALKRFRSCFLPSVLLQRSCCRFSLYCANKKVLQPALFSLQVLSNFPQCLKIFLACLKCSKIWEARRNFRPFWLLSFLIFQAQKMELWKIVFLSLILPPMSYQKQRGNTFAACTANNLLTWVQTRKSSDSFP